MVSIQLHKTVQHLFYESSMDLMSDCIGTVGRWWSVLVVNAFYHIGVALRCDAVILIFSTS